MTLKAKVQRLSAKLDERFGAGAATRLLASLSATNDAGTPLKTTIRAMEAQLGETGDSETGEKPAEGAVEGEEIAKETEEEEADEKKKKEGEPAEEKKPAESQKPAEPQKPDDTTQQALDVWNGYNRLGAAERAQMREEHGPALEAAARIVDAHNARSQARGIAPKSTPAKLDEAKKLLAHYNGLRGAERSEFLRVHGTALTVAAELVDASDR